MPTRLMVRASSSSRSPFRGRRNQRGRAAARMMAASAVRSQSASITPTESITITAMAEPACMSRPTATTSSTAVAESRRVTVGTAGGAPLPSRHRAAWRSGGGCSSRMPSHEGTTGRGRRQTGRRIVSATRDAADGATPMQVVTLPALNGYMVTRTTTGERSR